MKNKLYVFLLPAFLLATSQVYAANAGIFQSHLTHTEADGKGPGLACNDCHGATTCTVIDLNTTTACDPCHSQGGSIDGVAMAKFNWNEGIYGIDGKFQAGKEDWCLSCHDDNPAFIGTSAPNIAGDGLSYGFMVTGHGRNMSSNCLDCHDSTKKHIDGDHRTYYAASNPNNYQAGYRLASPLTVPIPWVDFDVGMGPHNAGLATLCFECHNATELLSPLGSGSNTNFNDGTLNLHRYHFALSVIWNFRSDSDFDQLVESSLDSGVSCIICHNVHGAPNSVMIRHGELISDPGTTNRVPAFNFTYVLSGGGTDPYADVQNTIGGDMQYPHSSTGWSHDNKVCSTCHNGQYYARNPYTGPHVYSTETSPATVSHAVLTPVVFTARVVDPDADIDTVTIDLSTVGGTAGQIMYDDGTHGDAVAGDEMYSFQTDVNINSGLYCLPIAATDLTGFSGRNNLEMAAQAGNEVILDNKDAVYVGEWFWADTSIGQYGCDLRFHQPGTGPDTVTWTPDLAQAGNYNVYAWWTEGTNRPTDARYTVNYNGGFTEVAVNQQIDGGQWNLLGTYSFVAGTSGSVKLTQNPNGHVIADAIKLVRVP